MAFGILLYVFLKATGILSEEMISIPSSVATRFQNNLTKTGTGGHLIRSLYFKSTLSCLEEHQNYCINGHCIFQKELKMPTCRCATGYSGERCEHLILNSYTLNPSDHYIAVGTGAAMLFTGISALIYCCIRKRYRKNKSSYQVCHEETAL